MSGEALARAVLQTALLDACVPWRVPAKAYDSSRARNREIEEACRFWADTEGEWAEAREVWCDAAGIDPDAARSHALREIAKARGACILTTPPSASPMREDRPAPERVAELRALSDRIFARRCQGASYSELRVEFGLADRELRSLMERGRLRAKVRRDAA